MHYTTIILTNRSYGLYEAFSLGILGINTCIIQLMAPLVTNTNFYRIWKNETPEAYLLSLKKINIPILAVKSVVYKYTEEEILINIMDDEWKDSRHITCNYLIFALDAQHSLLPCQQVSIENLSFKKKCYVIGEKALYKNKIFEGDIFTGEANLVAQAIYNDFHHKTGSISIHSTSLN